MESLPYDGILEWREDTMRSVRDEFNLDKPIINQAIDILVEWIKKQDHFNKKMFSREFLERKLMTCKGSVEQAKDQLDMYCTAKTLLPEFFEYVNLRADYEYRDTIMCVMLPKLTVNHHRVFIVKHNEKNYKYPLTNIYRLLVMFSEYAVAHDYAKGYIIIFDFFDADVLQMIKKLDIMELRKSLTILLVSFGFKIKGIYLISASKTIEGLLSMIKPFLSLKLSNLIQIHKNYETLYTRISKDLLPEDLGGHEKPLRMLYDQWVDVLNSTEFRQYFEDIKNASTNEAYRQKDTFNNQYVGMPGSFKMLNLD